MTEQKTWFEFAAQGDEEATKQILDSGFDVNATDAAKNTALHHATKQKHTHIMRRLIENGADLNAQNEYDSTPLHLTEKNIETIRILLEAGADPNIKDKDWDYPYYYAFYGSMVPELTKLYIKYGAHLKFVDPA